jgi:hypothetical protein
MVGRILGLILGLEITCFPTVAAIILTVVGQPEFVIGMAEGAIAVAGALGLWLFAHKAFEFFGEHRINLPRVPPFRQRQDSGRRKLKEITPGQEQSPSNEIVRQGQFKIKDSAGVRGLS